MPRGYYRNVDDQYSDPELIATQYQVGRNAYFEVQLTLAEFAESIQSGTGGLAGSPDIAQSLAGAGVSGGCPQVDQYVWIDDHKAVRAKTLKVGMCLYNPITRSFNRLNAVEILKGQPLVKIRTGRGAENIVSVSHKIIKNTADRQGVPLTHYDVGLEVLSADAKIWNIYTDVLTEMTNAGIGDVVKISLDAEYIYASGLTKSQGILAHNRKDPEIVE